jgi:hypothetical protein
LVASTSKTPPAALPPKHPWSLTRSAYDEKVHPVTFSAREWKQATG